VDLSDFSPSQREVVTAEDGPLSVLAGPGSGKTTVLAGRIAYLVDQRGISPSTIMAITFTTAAAATLRQRLAGVLGSAAQELTITTFHALGLRLIKQWAHELRFSHVPAVYGREDARALLRQAATGLGLEIAPETPARDANPWAVSIARLASSLDRFRLASASGGVGFLQEEDIDEELLAPLSAAYEELLQHHGAVDYPAMLTLPLQLFQVEPRALRLMQDAYRFVMADEFQDTTRAQFKLLEHIVDRHRNLAVVGDPKQAVYMWLGADPSMLVEFPRQYPEARVFPLGQNHRSTGVVVALSNALAAPLATGLESWTANARGPAARLYAATDELDEARFVAEEICRLVDSGHIEHVGQVAVLYRTNAQARLLAMALRNARIAFRVRADADLFAQPEVRDLVGYLRLAHCPSDGPALARVINVPPRRLRAIEQALRRRTVPAAELPEWAHKRGGPASRRLVEELLELLERLQCDAQGRPPAEVLELVLGRVPYRQWLETQKDGPTRLKHIEHLRAVMQASSAPDLETWLIDMQLGEFDGPADPDAKSAILTTIHGAKGAEWPVVFVVGCEDGLLPHGVRSSSRAPTRGEDEERRLAYVAFSRTQVLLYLVYCRARRLAHDGGSGRLEARQPSRFLLGLPTDLIERVERRVA
jgi:DNA helicase II / ATP-dependent DNA helicase PcrA